MIDVKSVTNNEISKPSVFENKSFDPDKRIDVNHKQDIKTKSEYNVDRRVGIPEKEVKGGSYSDVKKTSYGETHEVHHMPDDSASHLERDDGPAIKMEKADHRQTASCGSSREAREYQATQKDLIENGRFRDAVQMDINDIKDKFGSKYDGAISEMLTYVDRLEMEGKI